MASLSVIILTFNEELHIARAIDSVRPLADDIFVIDSYSTDRTVEIAREHGATVLQNPWVNHAHQFNWALDTAPVRGDWIMRLDADEIIEPDLIDNLRTAMRDLPPDVTGIRLNRKLIFMDRWVRHGGRYPITLLRVWRRGTARVEDRWMDEHMVLLEGRSVTVEGGFADWNLKDLTAFIDKHNKYATLEAVEVLNHRHGLFRRSEDQPGHDGQAGYKRFLKEKIYNRIPFTLSATIYFLYRYIIMLGFLDGREGFVYHFLQAYWYRFLVAAKTMELERAISPLSGNDDKLTALRSLTGLKLEAQNAAQDRLSA